MAKSKMSNKESVDSLVMLVTGSAKRIGAAIIRQAHSQGYNVIVHYNHSDQAAKSLINELNDIRADSAVAIQAALDMVNDTVKLNQFVQQVMFFFWKAGCTRS